MADVSEVVDEALTKEHVQRRVDDWVSRIDSLYGAICGWLPAEWTAQRRRWRTMDEAMMRAFGIGSIELPILDLVSVNGGRAVLEPRDLWIVGPNGRLALRTTADHFVIVDEAPAFEHPCWRIAPLRDRYARLPLDRTTFLHALTA